MAISFDDINNRYSEALEVDLRRAISIITSPLCRMMEYQLGWCDDNGSPIEHATGIRIHALLCLTVAEGISGKYMPSLPAASSVELVDNFSAIHSDIQSGSPTRGSRSTVWWIWGPAQAINAGDGLHALARLSLLRLINTDQAPAQIFSSIQKLDEACLGLVQGQYMDISYEDFIDIKPDAYLKMAQEKRGSLLACAAALGVLGSTDDPNTLEAFYKFGQILGMASQLRDDIVTTWGESRHAKAAPEILNKRKGFPVIYAMDKLEGAPKRLLNNIYFQRALRPEDKVKIVEILDSLEVKQICQDMASGLGRQAIETINRLGVVSSMGMERLRAMVNFMVIS